MIKRFAPTPNIDLSECCYNGYVGVLAVQHLDVNGNLIKITQAPNLIVDNARPILTHLLAEATATKAIGYIAVGTGTTAPTSGDLDLESRTGPNGVIGVTFSYPAADRVQFEATLPNGTGSSDYNNQTLTEAGLITSEVSGFLFARQTHGGIYKTSSIQLKYIWTIIFT